MSVSSSCWCFRSSNAKRCASASIFDIWALVPTARMNGVLACLCRIQWPSSWQSVYSCKFSAIVSFNMIVLYRLFLTVSPQVRSSSGTVSISIFLSFAMRRASYVACARYSFLMSSLTVIASSPLIGECLYFLGVKFFFAFCLFNSIAIWIAAFNDALASSVIGSP